MNEDRFNPRVFLSHNTADSDFADLLEDKLNAHGITSIERIPTINEISDFPSEPGTIFVGLTQDNVPDDSLQKLQKLRTDGTAVYVIPSGVGITPQLQSTFNYIDDSIREYDAEKQEMVLNDLASQAVAVSESINPDRPFFISYASENRHATRILKNLCEKNHVRVWLAEKSLSAGDDWKAEIDHQILIAPAVLLLISPYSMESHYVTYEWSYAMGCGTPVLPFLVNKCTDVHPKIDALHYTDFDDKNAIIQEVMKKV
jgi:hypothetical protein